MRIEKICGLSLEQALALYLYSQEMDKGYPSLDFPSISLNMNTAHPHSARIYDVASDFSRYIEKDSLLQECYDTARTVLNRGEG